MVALTHPPRGHDDRPGEGGAERGAHGELPESRVTGRARLRLRVRTGGDRRLSLVVLDLALEYASQRVQFGQPIAKFQATQFKLADIATELEAARWLTYRAASLRDAGEPFLKEAAMAKLKASRLATWAASEAVQIHGGLGYMLDSPVARFYCDAKVLEIGEGTNEIQHLVIARALGC